MKPKYRDRLPQLAGVPCICDGGLETHLIFTAGIELPMFAAFPLVQDKHGRKALEAYMRRFAKIALRDRKGFLMDTPTWRASSRWASEIEISNEFLFQCHQDAIQSLFRLREELEAPGSPFIVNGAIGPQDDGYNPQNYMTITEAKDYHSQQVSWFTELGADMVSAVTMTYIEEALGIAIASANKAMPFAISFTVETDGKLPSGQSLGDAIMQVDSTTDNAPAYFMINCAHPDHFMDVIGGRPPWLSRVMGIRANASRLSHQELDAAEELDAGDPQQLGQQYREMTEIFPNLTVMGGCCGTDHAHIDAISEACSSRPTV